ncbi:DUF1853 family protein, partial [Pseudomonas otitidis]
VRQQGKTLGEMDLLLQDDHGIHHVELAIKLYLGPQAAGGQAGEPCFQRVRRLLLTLQPGFQPVGRGGPLG